MSDTGSESPKSIKNIPNSINKEQVGNNDDNRSSSGTELDLTKNKEELCLPWPKPVHDLRRTPVENLDQAESEISGIYNSIIGTSIVNMEHGLNNGSQDVHKMVQSINGNVKMEDNRSSTGCFLKKEENKSQVPEVDMVNNGSIGVSESLISDRSFSKQKEVATLEYYSDSEVGGQVEKMNTRSGKVVGVKYVIKRKPVKKTKTSTIVHGKTKAVVTNEEFKDVNGQTIQEAEQKIKQQIHEADFDQKMAMLKKDKEMAEQRIREFDEAMRFLEVNKKRVELENKSIVEMIERKRIQELEKEKMVQANQEFEKKKLERDQSKQRKINEKKSNRNGSEIESYVTTKSNVMPNKDDSVRTWVEQHRSVSQAETLSMTSGSGTYGTNSGIRVTGIRKEASIISNRLQRERIAKEKSREARAKEAKRLAEKVEKDAEKKARRNYERVLARKLKREERKINDPDGRRRKKEKKKKPRNLESGTCSEETSSSNETTTSSDETYITVRQEPSIGKNKEEVKQKSKSRSENKENFTSTQQNKTESNQQSGVKVNDSDEVVRTRKIRKKRQVEFPKHLTENKFNGKNDSKLKALSWWRDVMKFANTSNYEEEEILGSFSLLLEKNSVADMWHEEYAYKLKTLEDIGRDFKKFFGPNKEDLDRERRELKNWKHNNYEDFNVYVSQVYARNIELGTPYNDKQMLRIIYDNMWPAYKEHIKQEHFTNKRELMMLVKERESYQLRLQRAIYECNGQKVKDLNSMEQLAEYKNNRNLRWHHRNIRGNKWDEEHRINSVQDDAENEASSARYLKNENNQNRQNQAQEQQQGRKWVFDESRVRDKGYNPLKFDKSKAKEAFGYNERHDCITCGLHGFVTSLCPCHNTLEQAKNNQDAFLKRREDDKIARGYSSRGNNRGNYRGGYSQRGRNNYLGNNYQVLDNNGRSGYNSYENNDRNEFGYGNKPMQQREYYNSNSYEANGTSTRVQINNPSQEQQGIRGNIADNDYKKNEINQVEVTQSKNDQRAGC